ncbi:hypothetical protein [Listeria booriae]|uniref:Uncharacterized protein n=1 Tax=Listeria booriae TaxID=1552123 RepID=A0A7X0XM70_9LIST|nr:hypothetical protein [Listeria booriae]MBC1563530.1 hypothetical protein [Listeria booriae]MBC1976175.1 hypothetical protein [Listeria booriae]MBC1984373.1 hypothetical protein [Listeria booriae]MBC2024823.1 hypothetical protein [Listeria booriae]MBC2033266.1 hypothetical protein [Listeria booriae]
MKRIISIIAILAILTVACSNQEKDYSPITSWKNEDVEVSKQEFVELTKGNNALEFKNGKVVIHDKDAVIKSNVGDVTTYFVQNAYIPIIDAKEIIKKDDWTKEELLTKYAGAAQNIDVNAKENTIEAFFITGPRGYGELRVTFDGGKLKSMTNTFQE